MADVGYVGRIKAEGLCGADKSGRVLIDMRWYPTPGASDAAAKCGNFPANSLTIIVLTVHARVPTPRHTPTGIRHTTPSITIMLSSATYSHDS